MNNQMINKDIETRADIELLVNSFYDKVRADEKIGYIFDEIIGADWSKHLPVMYDFWDMVLFSKSGYAGNPVRKHIDIDKKTPIYAEHFVVWQQLWNETVDALFNGVNAGLAKSKAELMAKLISMKVEASRDGNFVQ